MYGNPDRTRTLVEQVKSLRYLPGTGRFVDAPCAVDRISRREFDAKLKLLRSFGWTEAELVSMVRKFPNILKYSQTKLHSVTVFC